MKKPTTNCGGARAHYLGLLLLLGTALAPLALTSCNKNGEPVLPAASRLTVANYNQIHLGMSKAQVETILGAPTNAETQDKLVFKRTTYRYEEGTKFIKVSFKNDELDEKDSNLGTQ